MTVLVKCMLLLVAACGAKGAFAQNTARDVVARGITNIGGAKALRTVTSVHTKGIGHEFLLEQSERPEGPFFANYVDFDETLDFAKHSDVMTGKMKGAYAADWAPTGTTAAFEAGKPAAGARALPDDLEEARLKLALNPMRCLLLAAGAKDLTLEKDTTLENTPHRVVSFAWGPSTARIYFNSSTGLPTAAEYTDTGGTGYWSVWGDVTTRFTYGNWELEPGGLKFPTLWTLERNGLLQKQRFITSVEIGTAEPAAATDSELFAAVEPVPVAQRATSAVKVPEPSEIAPGILQYRGGFNTTVIEHPDGLVFIDAVSSTEYMEGVIADAQKRFPGKPIKAVISSTDSWPHIGGIRAFVAKQVAILALDANVPILERIVKAPHKLQPDTLELHPAKPLFVKVSGRNFSGTGPNRIEVYPVRGEAGERMQAVYFPEQKLLFAADLIQPKRDGTFYFPEYTGEVQDLIERHGLKVDTVFAMHSAPRPWTSVLDALRAVKSKPARSG